MKNIKVSRSYSAKIQLKQFEPVESWCSAEAEVEEAEMELASASLDKFVRDEVAKTLAGIKTSEQIVAEAQIERTPIPKFDFTDRSKLSPDQYGYGTMRVPGGATYGKAMIGKKKIDLRGEPKSRDVGRDDSERDAGQEL